VDILARADRPVSDAPALALRGITKRFGSSSTLDDASCTVRRGTVHALLGENGAGKSTLMNIAFGLLEPDSGTVEIDGHPVTFRSSADAIARGLGMVHQHFMLVPAFTVAENAALAAQGHADPASMAARVRTLATSTGLEVDPGAVVRDLPVGAQQRAEIVRALAHDARVLILDEPTAVLTPSESDELLAWLRRYVAGGGTAVLITHRIADVLAVADHVTVLRRGRVVLDDARAAVSEAALVRAIIGDEPVERAPRAAASVDRSAPVFALKGVRFDDERGVTRLRDASFAAYAGEIVGVLGVEGAGHREFLRLLAGRLAPSLGEVVRPPTVGFVPEDRAREAAISTFSLTENRALSGLSARRGRMSWDVLADETRELLTRFDVRASGVEQRLGALSGGNQQRFVVGRERLVSPLAIVAEQPTRGLDVRAAAQVWESLRAVALAGGVAIVHSADLDEVLAVATRVVVCVGGRLVEVQPPTDPQDRTPYARALAGLSA
jgi:ABC-type uncharacterized transport system ATPase subunit